MAYRGSSEYTRVAVARGACIALLVCLPGPVMGAGRTFFNGSLGVETEDYQYSSGGVTQDRLRLRARLDLNGRGFVWDPRFATYDAGITLERDAVHTTITNSADTNTNYNIFGYRLNTTWFANKPYALNLYANRSQTTVADYQTPSYALTTTSMGAQWGWENQWAGKMRFYLDRMQAESDNSIVPRSDVNSSFGVDSMKKLFAKQWGESSVGYGYRHNESAEQVYGSSQSQDYFYLNDNSMLGDKARLNANLTYYNRLYQYGSTAAGNSAAASSFLSVNSGLSVQQSEKLGHFYNLGLNMSETEGSQTLSENVSGGVNYRFNSQWQANASLGLNSTKTDTAGTTALPSGSQTQTSSSVFGSGGVQYSDKFDVYLINGGYNISWNRADTTFANAIARRSTTQSANIGYTRTGSPLYTDSLQLRMSQTLGEPRGSEANARYSVTSVLSQKDMLQGSIEYRRYDQTYALLTGAGSALDSAGNAKEYYSFNSKNTRMDLGWQHRFSDAAHVALSLGANNGENQGIVNSSRFAQARASVLFRSNLQWTALARMEDIVGLESYSGKKMTVESDLNYRLGKWQASARYRLRDARLQQTPFKEQSIIMLVKRDYGFSL